MFLIRCDFCGLEGSDGALGIGQDRASFRRFCGFSGSEPVPERTAFVRFRKALIEAGLDRSPFETVVAQLKAKAVRVKTGTIVDATIIASASEGDDEARWVKHRSKPAVHGFKALAMLLRKSNQPHPAAPPTPRISSQTR